MERYCKYSQVVTDITNFKTYFTECLNQTTENWRYGKALLYFYRKEDNWLYDQANLNLLEKHLNAMKQVVEKERGNFVICFVPGAVAVEKKEDINYFPYHLDLKDSKEYDLSKPNYYLQSMTDSLHINLLDLSYALKFNAKQPVYFPDSWHWNMEGHQAAAKAISNYLFTTGILTK
jgi:GDSL-like Lipase/Acylhydrolase